MKYLLFAVVCAMAVGCDYGSPPASADKSTPRDSAASQRQVAPAEPASRTNTGVNVRDRDGTAQTPMDQKENKADIATTADIRKRIVDTKMSVNAHNVKIITEDGKVTLRGPVNTEQEKRTIEQIAQRVAGTNKVDSQLEVNNK